MAPPRVAWLALPLDRAAALGLGWLAHRELASPAPTLHSLHPPLVPQLPSGGAGDTRKQQILKQQRWLLFLRHCARCQLGEAQCQYGRNCTVAKQLWQHLVHCKEPNCTYARCVRGAGLGLVGGVRGKGNGQVHRPARLHRQRGSACLPAAATQPACRRQSSPRSSPCPPRPPTLCLPQLPAQP